jgi:hypothetical protein
MWGVTIRPRGLFIRASLVSKVVFHLPAVKRSNVSFSIQRPIQYFQIEALQSIKYSRILAGGCQWLAYGFARS